MTTQLTGFKQDFKGSFIDKDPAAVLTYSVEWLDYLFGGDTLVSSSVTIDAIAGDPAGTALRVVSTGIANTRVFAIIDRGTPGEVYTVVVNIVTSNNSLDTRRFRIRVEERFL